LGFQTNSFLTNCLLNRQTIFAHRLASHRPGLSLIIFKVAGEMDKVTGKTFALVVNALFVYQYTCIVF